MKQLFLAMLLERAIESYIDLESLLDNDLEPNEKKKDKENEKKLCEIGIN